MKAPNERQLRAMIALRSNSDFTEFLLWLDESLHAQDIANRRQTGERLMQGQGKAQELEAILDQIPRAPDELSKLMAKESKKQRQ